MDGDALLWYQWEHRRRPIRTWEELKMLMLRKFRPSSAGTLHEQWLGVKQVGTVTDYRRSFIELAAPLHNIPEDIAVATFLNGLKEEIRAEIRLQGPLNVDQAMDLALRVEDKIRVGSKGRPNYGSRIYNPNTSHQPQQPFHPNTYKPNSPHINPSPKQITYPTKPTHNLAQNTRAIQRLTDQELQNKRE